MAQRNSITTLVVALIALSAAGPSAVVAADGMGPPAPMVYAPSANVAGLVAEPLVAETPPPPIEWPDPGAHGPAAPPHAPPRDAMVTIGNGSPAAPSATTATEALPLGVGAARSAGATTEHAKGDRLVGDSGWIVRTAGALALVVTLALFLRAALVRASRGVGGIGVQLGAGGRAPSGLLSVLGRYPVARGQTLVLLKVDTRVLLLCQSADGFSTLCEIADPEEVASILLKVRDEENESLGKRFGAMLRLFERDPSIAGGADGLEVEVSSRVDPQTAFAGAGPRPIREAPQDAVGSLRRRLATLQETGA